MLAFFVTGSGTLPARRSTRCRRSRGSSAARRAVRGGGGRRRPRADRGARCARAAGRSRSRYDRDGRVGALYGVAICPLIELAKRGGVVCAAADRRATGSARRRWRARVRRLDVVSRVEAAAMTDELDLRPRPGFVDAGAAAPSCPGLRLRLDDDRRRGRDAALPRWLKRGSRPLEPLPRRQRRRDAHAADPARLPRVLPPDRARPRRRPDSRSSRPRWRGCSTAAFARGARSTTRC